MHDIEMMYKIVAVVWLTIVIALSIYVIAEDIVIWRSLFYAAAVICVGVLGIYLLK